MSICRCRGPGGPPLPADGEGPSWPGQRVGARRRELPRRDGNEARRGSALPFRCSPDVFLGEPRSTRQSRAAITTDAGDVGYFAIRHYRRAAYPLRYSTHKISRPRRSAWRCQALPVTVTVRKGIALTGLQMMRWAARSAAPDPHRTTDRRLSPRNVSRSSIPRLGDRRDRPSGRAPSSVALVPRSLGQPGAPNSGRRCSEVPDSRRSMARRVGLFGRDIQTPVPAPDRGCRTHSNGVDPWFGFQRTV
jgi:hypothetical protein